LKALKQSLSLLLLGAGLACSSGLSGAPRPTEPPSSAPVPTVPAPTAPPASPAQTAAPPSIGGCQVFPTDNVWNARVDTLPLDHLSHTYVDSIGASAKMHADFGSGIWPPDTGGPIGIPYVVVPGAQAFVDVLFSPWGDESDPSPYPIPANAPIEGGPNSDGDRHVLVLDQGNCTLYELGNAKPQNDGTWIANCGAVFHLTSDALRPATWTSADAAGLPILPGLVRYDEVLSGAITHAIRFTAPQTQDTFIWPARHQAGDPDASLPPMGQRFRLKASFDISGFDPQARIILQALKTYGMILADNGSSWYISGAPDERWNEDVLHELDQVPGSVFEAVDESSLMADPDSGRAKPPVAFNHFNFLPNTAN